MKYSIKSLFTNKQGLAMMEFALFLPLLLVMFFGVVEFTRYVIITQKADRSAYVLSNITSQYSPISYLDSANEIDVDALQNQVFPQFARTMDAYNDNSDRVAIITSLTRTGIANNNTSLKINWQSAGGGDLSSSATVSMLNGVKASAINSVSENGSTGGTSPSFPSSAKQMMDGTLSDMQVGENMIITETFYNYKPVLSDILSRFGATSMAATTMKSVVFTRPRNGDLDNLKRPQPPVTSPPVPPPVVTKKCSNVPLNPPSKSCFFMGIFNCKRLTACFTCTHKEVCSTCTTPFNGTTTCVDSSKTINCTRVDTYTDVPNCKNGNGNPSTPPPTTPPAPPPS